MPHSIETDELLVTRAANVQDRQTEKWTADRGLSLAIYTRAEFEDNPQHCRAHLCDSCGEFRTREQSEVHAPWWLTATRERLLFGMKSDC